MSLQPGQTLLHYSIAEKIGEGGMGEVYRARDTKLGRDVAIKTLPVELSRDPDRLARFQREAQVLAALNHPGIAAIYGLEEVDDVRFLVLELVDGVELAERLKGGALATADALAVARQIAAAVEAAHEQGIVHRDLKPANIKLTPAGTVKVLDFGLAKALTADGTEGSPEATHSPTLTSAASHPGRIMGTPAYMSPEQARGLEVDKRSDIWSFGCLLLELLTGRSPFVESSVSDTLAAVLRSEPDWRSLPAGLAPPLERLLRRCLDKEPLRRLRDIGEARIALDDLAAGRDGTHGQDVEARPAKRGGVAGWVVVAAVLLTALATSWAHRALRPEPPPESARRFEAVGGAFGFGRAVAPVLSPDGRMIVFERDGELWLRHLDRLEPERLEGTAGASHPAWSPDSTAVVFAAGDDVKSVPVGGGTVTTVAAATRIFDFGDLVWGADDRILISSGGGAILEVSALGGTPRVLVEHEQGVLHFHELDVLPGGALVYALHRNGVETDTLAVFDGERTREIYKIDRGALGHPVYSPTGHVLFQREQAQAGIWALPFSADDLAVTGDAFLVVEDGALPSIAADGTLLHVRGDTRALRQLVWVGRDGTIAGDPIGTPLADLAAPALSPDGTRVATMGREGEAGNIWVQDIVRGTRTRLTTSRSIDWDPTWTPDGEQIVFWGGPSRSISRKRADGSGEVEQLVPEPLTDSGGPRISPDGRWMVFSARQGNEPADIWYTSLDGNGRPTRLVATAFAEEHVDFSPDGAFVAYTSTESGSEEIYVTPFPDGGSRWPVSVGGGTAPLWSPVGDRIFYTEGSLLKVATFASEPDVQLGVPRTLFDLEPLGLGTAEHPRFDVSRDGARFLMVQQLDHEDNPPALVLSYDWSARFGGAAGSR